MNFEDFDSSYDVVCVPSPEAGERIDALLARHCPLSRTRISALIESGHAFCGEKVLKKSDRSSGEEIILFVPPPAELAVEAEDLPLDIFYEDDHLLVINKAQGMVVHPAAGNPNHTLVNALLYHCGDSLSGIGGVLRPGIVHRLDKDTSGLIIVAKTDAAHAALSEQIRVHSFARRYFAVLWGCPKQEQGRIEYAIGRSKTDRKKMAAFPPDTPNTKNACTDYRVLERFRRFSFVEFTLHTGRTHQIRVHASKQGFPVVGDPVYAAGRDPMGQSGQLLHAAHISFLHPINGERLTFDAPPPCHMTAFLEKLRKNPHETV